MIEKLVKYKHIFISLFIFIILIMILFINLFPKNTKNEFVYAEEIQNKENDQNVTIKVDIKGSVKNPGVYQMKENDRVIDVINIAGGLLKEADTSLINLSKIVKDEMVIKVYNKNEIKKLDNKETIIKYIETECNCEDKINDACINNDVNVTETKTENKKISINTATDSELDSLPGIGLSKAKDIINYRNNNGNFKTIEDIKNVSGIGDSLFEKIKDLITT